jgi:hypothetical protein
VAGPLSGPVAAPIARFLVEIGIAVTAGRGDGFLPGIRLERGGLIVDEERLEYPGDLLHEAAHVAVAPASVRPRLTGAIEVPGVDTSMLEWAAIPWSYAAAVAIGIAPEEVFHDGGYHGHSPGLLQNFKVGVPIGLHLLEDAGMTVSAARAQACGVPPYPHMLHWLRP